MGKEIELELTDEEVREVQELANEWGCTMEQALVRILTEVVREQGLQGASRLRSFRVSW